MTDQDQAQHMPTGQMNDDHPTHTYRPSDQDQGKKGGQAATPKGLQKTNGRDKEAGLDDTNMDELGFTPGG